MGAAAASRRTIECGDLDVRATLKPLGVFPSDPTHRWVARSFVRAVRTPEGPGTVRYAWDASGSVEVEAWGDGATWLVGIAPHWLGAHDPVDDFDPSPNRRIAELWRRTPPFRLGGSAVVWQELAPAILGQRVTTEGAAASWRAIVRAWGEPAPGPDELGVRLPPDPEVLARRSYVELHRLEVERRRADVLLRAAARADRMEEAATMPVADALRRLTALPGLGAWTATATAVASHGDPDVVIVGDYGLPTLVSYAMTGDAGHVDGDDRMFELLEPYAGHRWRVCRLLWNAGVEAPRRGPKRRNPVISEL